MSKNSTKSEYIVRGALLRCDKGSHPRRLNLPKSHGVYALGHPLIRIDDNVAGVNISYFGVCNSGTPPKEAEEIRLAGYVPEGENTSAPDVQGFKCMPDILCEWKSVNEQACIAGDFAAVTTDSYLVCACGGIIQPLTSGQEYEDGRKTGNKTSTLENTHNLDYEAVSAGSVPNAGIGPVSVGRGMNSWQVQKLASSGQKKTGKGADKKGAIEMLKEAAEALAPGLSESENNKPKKPKKPKKPTPTPEPEVKTYVTLEQMKKLGWTKIHCGYVNIHTGEDSPPEDMTSEIKRKHRDINQNDIDKINALLEECKINTKKRIVAFFAECSAESGNGIGFLEQAGNDEHPLEGPTTRTKLDKWFKKYTGYGPKYRGAGAIQLTWEGQYKEFEAWMEDREKTDSNITKKGAEYVAMNYPWEAAVFFWTKKNLNSKADTGDIHKVTEVVNKKMKEEEYNKRKKIYDFWMKNYTFPYKDQEN